VRFDVFAMVTSASRNVALCGLVGIYQRCGKFTASIFKSNSSYLLTVPVWTVIEVYHSVEEELSTDNLYVACFTTVKMAAVHSSETLVTFYQITQYHVPKRPLSARGNFI